LFLVTMLNSTIHMPSLERHFSTHMEKSQDVMCQNIHVDVSIMLSKFHIFSSNFKGSKTRGKRRAYGNEGKRENVSGDCEDSLASY